MLRASSEETQGIHVGRRTSEAMYCRWKGRKLSFLLLFPQPNDRRVKVTTHRNWVWWAGGKKVCRKRTWMSPSDGAPTDAGSSATRPGSRSSSWTTCWQQAYPFIILVERTLSEVPHSREGRKWQSSGGSERREGPWRKRQRPFSIVVKKRRSELLFCGCPQSGMACAALAAGSLWAQGDLHGRPLPWFPTLLKSSLVFRLCFDSGDNGDRTSVG